MKYLPSARTAGVIGAATGLLLIGGAGGAVSSALITSAQIKNGTIRTVDLHGNAVTSAKIKNGTVGSGDIKDGGVTSADVANGSIGSTDLGLSARTYWAIVNTDGSLYRASDSGITSSDRGAGWSSVIFPVDVTKCAYVVSLGDANDVTNGPIGQIGTSSLDGDPKGVWVQTTDSTGTKADLPYRIIVDC